MDTANYYVEKITERLMINQKSHSFCDGLSGILYLFDFLQQKELLDIDISDVQELFENYLIYSMKMDFFNRNFDFLHGSLGVILYFLKKRSNVDHINDFIEHLYVAAEKDTKNHIFKWKSYIPHIKKDGYNLSLSHGISSLIITLSRMLKNNINNKYIEEMLNGSINYIFSQELDYNLYGSHYPSIIAEKYSITKSRLAWCYGDLGIAFALWQAGTTTNRADWKNKALTIFTDSTRRTDSQLEGVIDAGICHGSVGLSLIYRRLYIETGIGSFKAATDYWMNQTLKHARFEDGLAGYKTYIMGDWICDHSLLMGITGIGLTFISYLENDSQDWDELLLIS
jgi:hypothetical protein